MSLSFTSIMPVLNTGYLYPRPGRHLPTLFPHMGAQATLDTWNRTVLTEEQKTAIANRKAAQKAAIARMHLAREQRNKIRTLPEQRLDWAKLVKEVQKQGTQMPPEAGEILTINDVKVVTHQVGLIPGTDDKDKAVLRIIHPDGHGEHYYISKNGDVYSGVVEKGRNSLGLQELPRHTQAEWVDQALAALKEHPAFEAVFGTAAEHTGTVVEHTEKGLVADLVALVKRIRF